MLKASRVCVLVLGMLASMVQDNEDWLNVMMGDCQKDISRMSFGDLVDEDSKQDHLTDVMGPQAYGVDNRDVDWFEEHQAQRPRGA